MGAPPEDRASTVEGQIARVADIIAYVNHDIDDARRAGLFGPDDLPAAAIAVVGRSSSERIGRMVGDVIVSTLEAGLADVRMSQEVLAATLDLRTFLFSAVYENAAATAEFSKARGILGGLWEKVRQQPSLYLDERVLAEEGLDAAARDFLAGMTDRYAVRLYEQLFIPKPWVSLEQRAALTPTGPPQTTLQVVVYSRFAASGGGATVSMYLDLTHIHAPRDHVERVFPPEGFGVADDEFRIAGRGRAGDGRREAAGPEGAA